MDVDHMGSHYKAVLQPCKHCASTPITFKTTDLELPQTRKRFWQPSYWWDQLLDYFQGLIHARRDARKAAESEDIQKRFVKINRMDITAASPVTLDLSFLSETIRILTCPVCLELACPPLRLCKVGHFICGTCLGKVQTCPICRNPFTEARNFGLEGLTSMVEVKCRNRPCKRRINLDKLQSHMELECEYRAIVCNIPGGKPCHARKIEFVDYPHHLIQDHRRAGRCSLPFSVPYSLSSEARAKGSGKWIPRPFDVGGYRFILNLQIRSSVLLVWVSIMASEKQHRNISQKSKSEPNWMSKEWWICTKCNFKWILDVVHIHKHSHTIFNLRYCTKIPLTSLQNFVEIHADGNYYFTVAPKCYLRTS